MAKTSAFSQGVILFKQGKYENALEKFNEAIRTNPKDKSMYDSRAAIYEKLGKDVEALRDSKKVVDLAPQSWQGYARSARLFLKVGKPEASMKMADLALERVRNNDEQRRSELERIKLGASRLCEQKLAEAKARKCFFSILPVEICSEIFLLVGEKSTTKTVVLSSVCRRWRDIIIDMPMLWRQLVLTPATTATKVETWLRRARGTLLALQMRKGFSFQTCSIALRTALRQRSIWERLDTLTYQVPENADVSDPFPIDAFKHLNLRELEISFVNSHFGSVWKPLDTLKSSSIEVLHVSMAPVIPWPHLNSFTSLRSLTLIDCPFSFQEVYQVLTQRPQIEKLILMHASGMASSLEGPLQDVEPLELPRLLHFEIGTTNGDMSHFFSHLSFPNITTLSISCALRNTRYLDALEKTSTAAQLTELAIRRCLISQRSLTNLLRKAAKLERFVYSECIGDSTDAIVNSLSNPQGKHDPLVSSTLTIPCPSLQHVDLSGCQDLQAGPVLQLVKAHLASTQMPNNKSDGDVSNDISNQKRASRIRTLILNDCIAFDPQVLPWLRSKVETIHCTMNVKGKPRRRLLS